MTDDQRPTILGLSIVFPIIASSAVALRFKARKIKRLRLEADDWTILIALVIFEMKSCIEKWTMAYGA